MEFKINQRIVWVTILDKENKTLFFRNEVYLNSPGRIFCNAWRLQIYLDDIVNERNKDFKPLSSYDEYKLFSIRNNEFIREEIFLIEQNIQNGDTLVLTKLPLDLTRTIIIDKRIPSYVSPELNKQKSSYPIDQTFSPKQSKNNTNHIIRELHIPKYITQPSIILNFKKVHFSG
ncbi:MAG: hypothetical protein AB7S48_15205 [Bacteroidales bacterium]